MKRNKKLDTVRFIRKEALVDQLYQENKRYKYVKLIKNMRKNVETKEFARSE